MDGSEGEEEIKVFFYLLIFFLKLMVVVVELEAQIYSRLDQPFHNVY